MTAPEGLKINTSAGSVRRSESSSVTMLVAATFFMENLDGTIIATAIPQMARSFGTHAADMSLGITAYLLTLPCSFPSVAGLPTASGSGACLPARSHCSLQRPSCAPLPVRSPNSWLRGFSRALVVP